MGGGDVVVALAGVSDAGGNAFAGGVSCGSDVDDGASDAGGEVAAGGGANDAGGDGGGATGWLAAFE